MFKKNLSTILIGALALTLLTVPEAKAYVQRGLMKTGLFNPKLETLNAEKISEASAPTYEMELYNIKGETLTLKDLEGKVVFMNFWATWCPPCIAEMPSIQVLYDKFKDDKEVVILTVEVEGKTQKANDFMKNKNMSLPVYFPNSAIPREFFKGSMPTTIILDKKGNIAHTTLGMADYSGQDIVDFLNELKKY